MMLKSMRAAVPKSEMSNNSQTEMYTEMLDQQWAQSLAGKGIGLAEQLTRQLSGYTTRQAPELDSATTAFLDLPPSRPRRLPARRSMPGNAVKSAAPTRTSPSMYRRLSRA